MAPDERLDVSRQSSVTAISAPIRSVRPMHRDLIVNADTPSRLDGDNG
jgi:hypothetical protein